MLTYAGGRNVKRNLGNNVEEVIAAPQPSNRSIIEVKALSRLYSGSTKALLRLYPGSVLLAAPQPSNRSMIEVKGLLRLC
jgi:hypothetical protein